MNHTMKLTSDPFERIAKGKKIIEARLFDDKRKKIKLGDNITFFELPNLKKSVKTEVIGLSKFNDFKTLFEIFGTKPFGHPKDMLVDEQVKGMMEVYSKEDEKTFGVLGIHIRLVL